MPIATATATHAGLPPGVWLLLAVAGLLWAAGYLVACRIWPFTAHRRCGGTGRRPSPTGKGFRLCGGCGGSGRRLRFGRWLWNHVATTGRNARDG